MKNQSEIARAFNVSRQFVNLVKTGQRLHPGIEKALAELPERRPLTKREVDEVARRFASTLLADVSPSVAFEGDLTYDEAVAVEERLTAFAIRLWGGDIDTNCIAIVDDVLNRRKK